MDGELEQELRDAGSPAGEVGELLELAAKIAERSPAQPRPEWLRSSRERLLALFDQQMARPSQRPAAPE
jgi:hypothetical protein